MTGWQPQIDWRDRAEKWERRARDAEALEGKDIVRLAVWLSRSCCLPRWAIIFFSFTYGLLFVAALLSLFGGES